MERLEEMIAHFEDVLKRLKAARAAVFENQHGTRSQLDVLKHMDGTLRDSVKVVN